MNVELLNTDASGCSVTGNNCDLAHMADCILLKIYHCSLEMKGRFLTKWPQFCFYLFECNLSLFC